MIQHRREDGPSGEALPAVVILCEAANGVASGVDSFKNGHGSPCFSLCSKVVEGLMFFSARLLVF